MGRKRVKDKHLPPNVYFKTGYYYFVDKDQKWNNLGASMPEAMAKWAQLVNVHIDVKVMNDLFNRYMTEVAPLKSPASYRANKIQINQLRIAFGEMRPQDITAVHIYEYLDIRGKIAKVGANREKALLSHVYSKAIRWGIVTNNPCMHVKRIPERRRDRYIENEEFTAMHDNAPVLIQLAMDFAYLTALRKGDILKIKLVDLTPKGIMIQISKTKNKLLIVWSEDLRRCVEAIQQLHSHVSSQFLFHNRKGQAYTTSGFDAIWKRAMANVLELGLLKNKFRFHDIRRKAASDGEQLRGREYARKLLGHQDQLTTAIYISGVEVVEPLK